MAKKLTLIASALVLSVLFLTTNTVVAATKAGDTCTVTNGVGSCGSGFLCSNLRVPPGQVGQNGTLVGECQPTTAAGAGNLSGTNATVAQTSQAPNSIESQTGLACSVNPTTWGNCLINSFLSILSTIIAFFLNLFVGFVGAIGFTVATWFLQWAINVNQTLLAAPAGQAVSFAQYGFFLTLQFSNILIIIAMIILAFGTMFRQRWGSQNLPRLIVVALIINFSYFLATVAINISDGIMGGFITASGLNHNFANYGHNIASGFLSSFNLMSSGEFAQQSVSASLTILISPVFTLIFDIFAIIILFGISAMFFIRYIALTILLILLPLALTASLLPIKIGKGDIWSRWSQEFTKWLIFGPAMMFFVWLSFSLDIYSNPISSSKAVIDQLQSSIAGSIATLGILLGGAMIANEMGVVGAKQLNNAVQQTSKWFQTQAKDYATRPLRTEKGKEWTKGLQASSKIPFLPYVGRQLNVLGAQGEKTINTDQFKNLSGDRLAAMLPTLSGSQRVVALAQLAKTGDLDKVTNISDYLTDSNKKLFGLYNQNFGAIEKGAGMSIEMSSILKDVQSALVEEEAATTVLDKQIARRRVADLQNNLTAATKKFIDGLSDKDFSKLPLDKVFQKYEAGKSFADSETAHIALQNALALGVIKSNPSNYKKLFKVKGKNFSNVSDALTKAVDTYLHGTPHSDWDTARKFEDTVKKALSSRLIGTLNLGSEEENEESK